MPANDHAQPPVRAAVLGDSAVFTWQRALHVSARDLPESVRYTLLVLALYMDPNGTNGRPGLLRLAEARGKTERTVRTHLESAIAAGWLVCVRRGGRDGAGVARASIYAAAFPQEVFIRLRGLLAPAWGEAPPPPQPEVPGLPLEEDSQPEVLGLPLEPGSTGNPAVSTGNPGASTGSPALPPTDPSHRPVTPISQSARDAEAVRWLHARYGLTDEQAGVVIDEARRRAGAREIKSLVRYLERMAVDEHGNPKRDLADVVEAVQLGGRSASGGEEEGAEPEQAEAAETGGYASPAGCRHNAPTPDRRGCTVCDIRQARSRPVEAAQAVQPPPLVVVMPAQQARDEAHLRFCEQPRCGRCEGIRALEQGEKGQVPHGA